MLDASLPSVFNLQVVQEVAGEPVDVAFVRNNARVSASASEDAWFTTAIAAARQQIEQLTRRSLIRRQFKLVCASFESVNQFGETRYLALPQGPALELTSLGYRRVGDGVLTQMDVNGDAIAEIVRESPRGESALVLKFNQNWPSVADARDAVVVEWWAGVPAAVNPQTQQEAAAAACPQELRLTIARLVANQYENRHAATEKLGGFAVPEDVGSEIRQACWRWTLAY